MSESPVSNPLLSAPLLPPFDTVKPEHAEPAIAELITKCREQNQAKVSQKCNADRVTVVSLIQARLAAQAAAPKLCERDAAQYCKGVKPGAGHILRCLLKAQPSVSEKCNTAIDLAGYR